MVEKMLPLEDFLKLDSDEQVEKLKRWKMKYTLKDIREAWNFKHSAQYYMLLKKLRIYERVVNKSDKFYPQADNQRLGADGVWRTFNEQSNSLSDHFNFQLNTTITGTELAEKLERIAYFLKGEAKNVSVKLSIVMSESDNKTELA
ncbi:MULTISPECIES: hypothetical protein [Paenibacillus]|uniref:hypothetical protein n=1 Tax=Paenibacillus TaxID=44249 RepID=UPI00203A6B8D|nr:hypothetical protein [Paenibacillus camelliae]MCM3633807.1 hypothetical protein [Paenibacillus camelliae]